MAQKTNYDTVRAAYLKNQRKQQSQDERVWTPPGPGRYPIRVLPPWPGGAVWFFEYGMHYRVRGEDEEGGPVTCPRLTLKKKCPICEFVRGLYRSGEEADRATARDIRGVKRFRSNIVLPDKPGEARIYSYGQKVWEQLAELCVGDEGGVVPIDDPEHGYNLTLVVTQVKTESGTFPQYLVKPSMTPTPLKDQNVLKGLHDLSTSILEGVESADAIRAILMGKKDDDEPGPGQESEPAVASEAAPSVESEPTEEVVSDTEAAESTDPQDVIRKAREHIRKREAGKS